VVVPRCPLGDFDDELALLDGRGEQAKEVGGPGALIAVGSTLMNTGLAVANLGGH
jgi:hypothetical protein